MSSETADDAAWSVVDAATHGSSTHRGSAQRSLWPLEPLVPSTGSPGAPQGDAAAGVADAPRRPARRG